MAASDTQPHGPGDAERFPAHGGTPPGHEARSPHGGLQVQQEDEEETEGTSPFLPGGTIHERTVVQEAEWGKTSGAPSGGVAGGNPASEQD